MRGWAKRGASATSFAEFDTDGDGMMSVDDVVAATSAIRPHGKAPSRARLESLWPQFASGEDTLAADGYKALLQYLDRGHAVQDELALAWAKVETVQSENKALKARLAAMSSSVSPSPQPVAQSNATNVSVSGTAIVSAPAQREAKNASLSGTATTVSAPAAALVAAALAQAKSSLHAEGRRLPSEAVDSDALPEGYLVSGAGSSEVNGYYERDGEYGGAPLFKFGQFWLLRYTMRSGNHCACTAAAAPRAKGDPTCGPSRVYNPLGRLVYRR
jgi:hypothetical protein